MLTKSVSFLTPVAKPDIAGKNSPAAPETIIIIKKKKNICQTDGRTPETKNIFLIQFSIHRGFMLPKVFLNLKS